ncbi:MAG: hypothetical protein RJA49_1392 [Actinomycetota bacterium]
MPRRAPSDVEIIEVLDPNDPSIDWSSAASSPPPPGRGWGESEEPPGRPWWPWVAAIAAAALVVVAVTAVLHREPRPTMAVGRYVVADAALRAYSAEVVTPPKAADAFVLWTGERRDQPFVSVQAESAPATTFVAFDSVIRITHGTRVVSPVDDRTTSTVVRKFSDGTQIVARGTGLTDDQFIPLVNSITVEPDAQGALSVSADPSLLHALGLSTWASTRTVDQALYGDVTSTMRYLDDHSDVVTLRVADTPLAQQVRTLRFLSREPVTVQGDRTLAALSSTGENVVVWQEGGHQLTLSAVGDPSRLLDLSHHVRGATEKEWNTGLRFLRPDYRQGDVASIAHGRLWQAAIQRTEQGGKPKYLWRFSLPDDEFTTITAPLRFDPAVMPFADRVVVDGVTYVFVSVPRSSGVTTATVFFGDHDVQELELRRPFPDVPMLVSAFRVDNPVPVRVVVPGAVDN